jgi:hypothetical protein
MSWWGADGSARQLLEAEEAADQVIDGMDVNALQVPHPIASLSHRAIRVIPWRRHGISSHLISSRLIA